MIRYEKGYSGVWIVLRIIGTTWPSAVPPGLLAAGISLFMGVYSDIDVYTRDRDAFLGHPYAFRLFSAVVTNLLIFKMNAAYQRYWEAAGAMQSMATKWLDGACMAVTFDAAGDSDNPYLSGSEWQRSSASDSSSSKGGPDHTEYVADVLHLCSLLHAVTLLHLRRDSNLDNLVPSKLGPRHTIMPSSPSFWSERSMFSPEHISDLYKIQKIPVLGGLRPEARPCIDLDLWLHTELPMAPMADKKVDEVLSRAGISSDLREKQGSGGCLTVVAVAIFSSLAGLLMGLDIGYMAGVKSMESFSQDVLNGNPMTGMEDSLITMIFGAGAAVACFPPLMDFVTGRLPPATSGQ
eukprot:s3024_g10.t1